MSIVRAKRVGRQVLHEISAIVEYEIKDPRLELVTFTGIRMSPDLRTAWISFSCLEPDRARASCEAALASANGYLRREIGRRLCLRYVPKLQFEYDDSLVRAERISRLLDSTTKKDLGNDD